MKQSVHVLFRRIFVLVLVLFCSGVSTGLFSAVACADDDIDVGIILPLSGEVAFVGNAVRNGILDAYESLPTAIRDRIRLHFQDDGFQPKNSLSALNQLIAESHIDVLINVGSSTGNALAPVAESKRLPFIAIATDSKVSRNRRFVFNLWVSVDKESEVAVAEVRRRGYRRLARIGTIHDMASSVKRSFDKSSGGAVEVVLDEEYASDVKDFKPFLAKIRAERKVDAIMTVLFPGQIGIFAKQARQMGVELPLFTYELFEDAAEVRASDGALVGQWYVNAADPQGDFLTRYRARFGESSSFGAANGHDAILLIAAAAQNGLTMEDLPEFLRTLKDFNGALGTFSASSQGHFTLPACAKLVTATGSVPLP